MCGYVQIVSSVRMGDGKVDGGVDAWGWCRNLLLAALVPLYVVVPLVVLNSYFAWIALWCALRKWCVARKHQLWDSERMRGPEKVVYLER